jgi:hypothetical protein
MTVDVIILTDSTDVTMTQRTIDTLHNSESTYRFRIQLVDSGGHQRPAAEVMRVQLEHIARSGAPIEH